MSHEPKLELIVVGVGTVGGCWLEDFAPRLPADTDVIAVANSRRCSRLVPGADPWQALAGAPQGDPLEAITDLAHARWQQGYEVAILDLTASAAVSARYISWVQAGAHLISANKLAGSAPLQDYQHLRQQLAARRRHWLYNTTVGAGLPIQQLLAERLACGDSIHRMSGNLSGSLSWLFQQLAQGGSFSRWLQEAARRGLTEPDPRADLSGTDVARKVVILARELGWLLAPEDVEVTSLLPPRLAQLSLSQFWYHSECLNQDFPAGAHWEYVATLWRDHSGQARARVQPERIEPTSELAGLPAGSTRFTLTSDHYQATPLVLQGPGAGLTVTAAGVMSDVLTLARQLHRTRWGTFALQAGQGQPNALASTEASGGVSNHPPTNPVLPVQFNYF